MADDRDARIAQLEAEAQRRDAELQAARAEKDATVAIPIVMAQRASPVEDGFVASLARPGGNVTGLTTISRELIKKRLELFKEAVPGLSRVGVLWHPGIAAPANEFRLAEAAAGPLGLELRSLEVRDPEALQAAFEHGVEQPAEALLLLDNPILVNSAARVSALALLHRLPMCSMDRVLAAAGGLLAYGADRGAVYRRAAGFVDRILKGASPAEMPIERPTAFELAINLGTAQTLGLTIPQSVLQQATEVIQ